MVAVNDATGDGDKKKLRALADKLVEKALEGDVSAIKEIGDRIDGKPKQQIEHSGDQENPVAMTMALAAETLAQRLAKLGVE